MAISAAGLGSNLDVNGIVSQLMQVEQQPITRLQVREASYQAELSALGSFRGALSSFQGALSSLKSASKFLSFKATVADTAVASASATSAAAAGSYSLEVSKLAQAQKINSGPFTDTTSSVGSGTLTIQFGSYDSGTNTFTANADKATRTVSIAAGQDSLAAIRDTINNAKVGVSASIVNDGSGNRLVIGSGEGGAANSLRITVADNDSDNLNNAGLSRLAFDPTGGAGTGKNMVVATAAQDAEFKVDGVSMTRTTNSVSDAIEGVSLQLLKINEGSPTQVTVGRDTAAVRSSIDGFVKAYNDLSKTIGDLAGFNAETKKGGTLLGDSTVLSFQSQMRSILGTSLPGTGGNYSRLAELGITLDNTGKMSVNASRLQTAMDNNFGDIASLFSAYGRASDSLVSMGAGGDTATPGRYSLEVTRLGTQGKSVGSAVAGLTITQGVNDTLSFTVDGASTLVTLSAGTYGSAEALAAEVQSKVNGASALSDGDRAVTVSVSSGVLTMTSDRWGSASEVRIAGGSAAETLFGATRTETTGVDIAGTIGGIAATGSGQTLTGATGTRVEGLAVKVSGGSTGSRGTVDYSQGYAYRLDAMVSQFLDPDGLLKGRTDGIDSSIKQLGTQRTAIQRRLVSVEQRYRAQFTALDTLLSQLQSTSSFLSQQLAALPSIR